MHFAREYEAGCSLQEEEKTRDTDRTEEMTKLSKKVVKLELEAKNLASKNFYNAPNRGYNP